MTNLQTGEYDDLLKYLEKQKPKEKFASQPKKQASIDTKKLLEECTEKIHADHPLTKSVINSDGFDVFKFESLMRSKLIDSHKKGQSYKRPYISVTEITSCIRKCYYARMKYPINIEKQYDFSYLHLINHTGNAIHDYIQQLYDHTEVEKTILSETFQVKGRVDGIRDDFILEYKTIDADKFKNKFIEAHYHQGNIYAHILNTEYNYNIKTVTIVYILRNLKRIVPFDTQVDAQLAEKYLYRGPILKSSIESKKVPDSIGADKEQCKWCSYKKYCEKDETKILQPFKEKEKVQRKNVMLL